MPGPPYYDTVPTIVQNQIVFHDFIIVPQQADLNTDNYYDANININGVIPGLQYKILFYALDFSGTLYDEGGRGILLRDVSLTPLDTLKVSIIPSDTGTICVGDTVTLTSNPSLQSTHGYNYIWSTMDTTSSITVSPIVTTTYSLAITDINGCIAYADYTVKVYPVTIPTISGKDTVCQNIPYTYYTEGGQTNYNWSVSPGGIIIAGGNTDSNYVTVLWDSLGSQSVSINYKHGFCQTTTTIYNVTVNPVPVVNAGNDTTICQGSSVILGSNPTA